MPGLAKSRTKIFRSKTDLPEPSSQKQTEQENTDERPKWTRNGAAVSQPVQTTGPLAAGVVDVPAAPQFGSQKVQELFQELEVPFDASVIEWRVTNAMKDKPRGQVVPYADQRAYTDRLNALVTPAGWTRKYAIHTSANFQRGKDQRIVAKILVTCELTIFGLGSHSATGEEWADHDNAGTSAEAQAFRRACSCFGLGRYLYHFSGVWVDLDERKRPKAIPRLFGWATPQGWRQGLRPGQEAKATENPPSSTDHRGNAEPRRNLEDQTLSLVRLRRWQNRWETAVSGNLENRCQSLESIRDSRGRRLSRVLAQMQSAERGLRD